MKQRFLEILWRSRDWDSALSLLGVQVCFLVRELRSCKLCSMAKHTHTHTQNYYCSSKVYLYSSQGDNQ